MPIQRKEKQRLTDLINEIKRLESALEGEKEQVIIEALLSKKEWITEALSKITGIPRERNSLCLAKTMTASRLEKIA